MRDSILFIFSGLPGAGKSTLAKELARVTSATYLRIDTVEQAIRDLCNLAVEAEGYELSYKIALDNLLLGNDVIADSCNPIGLSRQAWNEVAIGAKASYVNIEVICSSEAEHRNRVETRVSEVAGLEPPTWESVQSREYHLWTADRIVIDTAGKSIAAATQELLDALGQCDDITFKR